MARREFQFVEGTSSKFWAIDLAGTDVVVAFGRIGTAGQTQRKEFASADAAKKQYDKLIAEKVGKGYKEVGGDGTMTGTSTAAAAATGAPATTPAVAKPKAAKQAKPVPEAAAAIDADITPPTPAAAPPAAKIEPNQPRSIDLAPEDWTVATFRPRPPLPRPPAEPFDLERCCEKVRKVGVHTYGWHWTWSDAQIPVSMTGPEAHFWLTAMAECGREMNPRQLAEVLARREYTDLSPDDALKLLGTRKTGVTAEVFLPLAQVLSLDQLIDVMEPPANQKRTWQRSEMHWCAEPEVIFGFGRYVLPYLNEADRERLRARLRAAVTPANWPTNHYDRPAPAFFVAAAVGLADTLLAVVQSWKDDQFRAEGWDTTHYHQPQLVLFGLGAPQLIEAEFRRLKVPLNREEYIRGFLATTEYAALDVVRDSILAITNKEECEKLTREFARVHAPEAAPHMLELKRSSKAPKLAREWLEQNLSHAIAGLIPVAAGRGTLADAAVEFLRDVKRSGQADAIVAAGGTELPERVRKDVIEFVDKVYAPFDASNTPEWLKSAAADAPKPKLPGWLPAHAIPPVVVGDRRLSDAQAIALVGALQKSSFAEPHPLIKAVREHADGVSRDAFAWKLFEGWVAEGAPSKEKWAMGAIGHVGDDGCVLKLTPLIRAWPGESQHQRAVFGLECLKAIGSDTALMALNGVAQKLKFKGLKTKAMEFMDAIASARNMTRAQLEDRIVPDCDLDERGTRVFDFGPRQFRLVLGQDFKPMIKDDAGKVKSDLPSPNSKDDAVKAGAAVDAWKVMKKQIKEVVKVQADRLEQAMVTGRRWAPEEFQTLLVRHPLMVNLVRLLVWAGYDDSGKVIATFRVTEDQTLADENDDAFNLPAAVKHVGIIHPAHLSPESMAAWGQVLGDYELIPPFPQLGRRVYQLEPGEGDEKEFKRFEKAKVPGITLVGILERLGWVRGIPQDGGVFHEHSKPFYGADVTCIVQYEPGVPVGYMTEADEQSGVTAMFIPGIYNPKMYPDHNKRLKLKDIDPVVMSEVIKDLAVIAAKAEEQ
jgi:predicted DNA-binding WGR domain protein